jgi:hypothetical protein
LGYYYNEKLRYLKWKNLPLRFFISLTMFIGILLAYPDLSLLVFSIYLTFAFHNIFPEKSWVRVFTWFLLNIGKIFVAGGGIGIVIFSPIIIKRAFTYIKNKKNISSFLAFILTNVLISILIYFFIDNQFFYIYLVVVIYTNRSLLIGLLKFH